jgi:hypothetical protein
MLTNCQIFHSYWHYMLKQNYLLLTSLKPHIWIIQIDYYHCRRFHVFQPIWLLENGGIIIQDDAHLLPLEFPQFFEVKNNPINIILQQLLHFMCFISYHYDTNLWFPCVHSYGCIRLGWQLIPSVQAWGDNL